MNENGILRDPTMNDHDSHIVEMESDRDNIELHQKFKVLQQEWESYIQSNPRTARRYSADHSAAMAKAVQLLDSSPRNLISSLQQKWSPPKGGWKIRTNNLAAEELLTERRSVIESGRLKGRRLFQAVEDETHEMGLQGRSSDHDYENIYYNYGGNGTLVQEINDVKSVSFYDSDQENDESGVSNEVPEDCFNCCFSSLSSSSSSSPSHQNVELEIGEEEKKVQAIRVETRRVAHGGNGNINGRISWMVFMGWFVFASIIYAVFIAPMRIFGGYGYEHHEMQLLVPT